MKSLLILSFLSFTFWLLIALSKTYENSKNISEANKLDHQGLRLRILDNKGNVDFKCTKYSTCLTQMIESQSYTFQTEPKTWFAVNVDLKRVKEDIVIVYKSDNEVSQTKRRIQLSAPNIPPKLLDVPMENNWERRITKEELGSYNQLVFEENNLSNSIRTTTISMNFETKVSDNFSSSSSSSTSHVIAIVLSSVGGLFLILSFIGFYCWIKHRRQRRNDAVVSTRTFSVGIYTSYIGSSKSLVNVEINDPLTPENLNERFPETDLEQLKSSYPQSTCSICLEELQKGQICRQLYCQHIFHSGCVKKWLEGQLIKGKASCPNCNKCMIQPNSIPRENGTTNL